MGRAPCCDKANVKKGPWSPEEDARLKDYIEKNGTGGNWIALPQKAGLKRCGKSCRLRWLNYLRPNIKHGEFSEHEDRIICTLYATIGSRWSIIAAQLPGRTDNDIKNYWNTKLKKKLMGLIPLDQRKIPSSSTSLHQTTPPSQTSPLSTPSYYTSSTKSLAGLETFSDNQYPLYNNINNNDNNISLTSSTHSYHQMQESWMNPMQFYHGKDNMLMFGSGNEASCSSSDGSCSQISYGKEMKQEQVNGIQQGLMLSNSCYDQETQKFLMDYSNGGDKSSTWADQKPNLFSPNSGFLYDLEDVKQLINSSGYNDSSGLCFNDENKIHGRDSMYYY